jgi:hypothetical protein
MLQVPSRITRRQRREATFTLPRDWRHRSPVELETLIDQIRRAAVVRHVTVAEWKVADRVRKRLKEQTAA